MDQGFRRDYLLRLPLPLAQLYSRAHNAKDIRTRHDNCFYIFESLIKLSTCPLIGSYLDDLKRGRPHNEAVDRAMSHLALPSLGQWVGMLRELARHYGESEAAKGHPLRLVWRQLTRKHNIAEAPGIVGLYRRIKDGPDGKLAADTTCTLLDLFDKLVRYRNDVVGHGGPRFDNFFETEMGPRMFPAVNEVLDERHFEPMGPPGTRLVYMTEMRLIEEGTFEVSLRELIGLQGERSAPMTFNADLSDALAPRFGSFPGLALLWPGHAAPMRLGPMMRFRESEVADEVLLLNRDRGGRQVEYLSYTTGRTERDKEMAGAMAMILSRISKKQITEDDVREFEQHSRSEGESVEALMGDSRLGSASATMLGDYELLAELGRGGMGVVYLARQASLGRVVALKTLPGDLSSNDRALARFRREMRVLGNAEHPNIVKLLDSGTLADGQMYYTMEYVPGADLEQVWKQLKKSIADKDVNTLESSAFTHALLDASQSKRDDVKTRYERTMNPLRRQMEDDEPIDLPPLPLPELLGLPGVGLAVTDNRLYVERIVELIRDAARALHTVHEQGVIHRDVSPGNLMLTPDGQRIVLMDFGLAKGGGESQTVSMGAGFMGKLRYAAPEQLASAVLDVGASADVRGLGTVLWELLTRRRLFGEAGDERALATMIHQKDVPRLRDIEPGFDRDLEAIVARATEREIDKRIQTAEELADYLDLYLVGEPLPIRPPTTSELVWRWVRRRKAVVISVAASIVLFASVISIAFYQVNTTAEEALDAKIAADLAREKAEQARQDAELAQVQAQESLENTRDALKNILEALINSDEFIGRYESVRDLLVQIVTEYQDILRGIDDDEITVDLAYALRVLAETNLSIAESSQSSAQAEDATEEVLQQTQEAKRLTTQLLRLLEGVPEGFEVRYERAMAQKVLARVYKNTGDYQRGLDLIDESIAAVNEIVDTTSVLAIPQSDLLSANADALRLQGELYLSLADKDPGNADKHLQDALSSFATAETIWQNLFRLDAPERVLATDLATVKLSIAEILERNGANADAHIVYTSIINRVLSPFELDAAEPALRLTTPMRLRKGIALRRDAVYRGLKQREKNLQDSVELLERIATENPDRLRYQIEYARSLLAVVEYVPLTDREIRQNPEAFVGYLRNREDHFTALVELFDRLLESYPEDSTVIKLRNELTAARAQFDGAAFEN